MRNFRLCSAILISVLVSLSTVGMQREDDIANLRRYLCEVAFDGNATAAYRLGYMCENDPETFRDAMAWYTLAANLGSVESFAKLDSIYRNGLLGMDVDLVKANECAEIYCTLREVQDEEDRKRVEQTHKILDSFAQGDEESYSAIATLYALHGMRDEAKDILNRLDTENVEEKLDSLNNLFMVAESAATVSPAMKPTKPSKEPIKNISMLPSRTANADIARENLRKKFEEQQKKVASEIERDNAAVALKKQKNRERKKRQRENRRERERQEAQEKERIRIEEERREKEAQALKERQEALAKEEAAYKAKKDPALGHAKAMTPGERAALQAKIGTGAGKKKRRAKKEVPVDTVDNATMNAIAQAVAEVEIELKKEPQKKTLPPRSFVDVVNNRK